MIDMEVPKLGDVVYSKNGRFKGECFVVIGIDGDYVYMSNGKQRKMDSPKKKKIKHLTLGIGHSDHIGEKLEKEVKVTNNELRITLSKYMEEE